MNVTLFRNKVFADIIKMKFIRVGPDQYNSVLIRKDNKPMRMPCYNREKLELCFPKQRSARDWLLPLEVRKSQQRILRRLSEGTQVCWNLDFRLLIFRIVRESISVFVSLPVGSTLLWQPKETNTVPSKQLFNKI